LEFWSAVLGTALQSFCNHFGVTYAALRHPG
jgi:hypothetical protein